MKGGSSRGRVETVKLRAPFTFNGNVINTARIEIDHINYGLNKRTGELNEKPRSSFNLNDIELFLGLLDGEYLMARDYRKQVSRFEVKVDCSIPGPFLDQEFILIFETDYARSYELHTITLYLRWEK